jgi:outer membrane protein OmpA-like peptidoglycan-associated protein
LRLVILGLACCLSTIVSAQTNLLLNGGFEEVNTCTEYKSECGVEAWFYLKDVKARMLANEENTGQLGNNSFGIFFNWQGFTGFYPVIGTLLPCYLQKGKTYTFKGTLSASLHTQLILQPGICLGNKFYVPGRSFSQSLHPDTIRQLRPLPSPGLFGFEYSFIATGEERYLSFGTYIREDSSGAKKKLIGIQTVQLMLDNFTLEPSDPEEGFCDAYSIHKDAIYQYDYRHREMDYSLFGKGELAIKLPVSDGLAFTRKMDPPAPVPFSDTLLLGDLLFDFNKALLRADALQVLENYFRKKDPMEIDSLLIEGHTDSVGSDQRNIILSTQRCESVKTWLTSYWKENTPMLKINPFGRSRPVADNQTAAGRALNRRVELIIFRRTK